MDIESSTGEQFIAASLVSPNRAGHQVASPTKLCIQDRQTWPILLDHVHGINIPYISIISWSHHQNVCLPLSSSYCSICFLQSWTRHVLSYLSYSNRVPVIIYELTPKFQCSPLYTTLLICTTMFSIPDSLCMNSFRDDCRSSL